MATLSPRIASELADLVYQIREANIAGDYRLFTGGMEVDNVFDFDLSRGPIHGVSGGFFGFFQKSSGFALVGEGKNAAFKNDHVIAVRGTRTAQDWLTNGNVGVSVGYNGSTVHAGFNDTFESMKPALERILTPRISNTGHGTVHCVGHSLGGALAGLAAEWVRIRYKKSVKLYTFGAPRVGLNGFAEKSTFGCEKIYRCTHGADPVPKVPLWPFTHAPNNGSEFRLDGGQGISKHAHGMGLDANPGYRNTAKSNGWKGLQKSSNNFLNQPVRLKYQDRYQASFSTLWADKIGAALITLLKDAGYYHIVLVQAGIGTTLTFYDLVARTLEEVAKASVRFAEQTAGLLGHMLVFAGKLTVDVVSLTYQFIKWVFDQTKNVLYRVVKQALKEL
ncbi:lipase family protein [Marinobacter sp. ANT_B65]|uniref:lipase family protein n=1 Tax=Marinobacter sp. ANT_B65 TaxID=2039467 RepID=UPI000BBEF066|nr:lipase family protein [Marinobacter sp. ANT_B65]PCM44863.1 lipase [Marinobacter sp. ANT_B65]